MDNNNTTLPCITKSNDRYRTDLLIFVPAYVLDILLKYGVIAGDLAESIITNSSEEDLLRNVDSIDVYILGGDENKVKNLIKELTTHLDTEIWFEETGVIKPKYREESIYLSEERIELRYVQQNQYMFVPIATSRIETEKTSKKQINYLRLLPTDLLQELNKYIKCMDENRKTDLITNNNRYYITRDRYIITLVIRGLKPIRIILSSFNTVEQLVSSFNIDVVQCAIYSTDNKYTSCVTEYARMAHKSLLIRYIKDVPYSVLCLHDMIQNLYNRGYVLPNSYKCTGDLPLRWHGNGNVIGIFRISFNYSKKDKRDESWFYDINFFNMTKEGSPVIANTYFRSVAELLQYTISIFDRNEHNKYVKLCGPKDSDTDLKFVSRAHMPDI